MEMTVGRGCPMKENEKEGGFFSSVVLVPRWSLRGLSVNQSEGRLAKAVKELGLHLFFFFFFFFTPVGFQEFGFLD